MINVIAFFVANDRHPSERYVRYKKRDHIYQFLRIRRGPSIRRGPDSREAARNPYEFHKDPAPLVASPALDEFSNEGSAQA